MGDFFAKFGNGVKGVISGMILGVFLLPLGVYMQKCAVDQIQYHKYFQQAVNVTGPVDSKITKSGTLIWTEGAYQFTGGAPFIVKNAEGDTYPGEYITYYVKKYNIVKELKQEKNSSGQVVKEYYEYSWKSEDGNAQESPSVSVAINGYNVSFDKFNKKYISSQNKYFKYARGMDMNATRGLAGAINVQKLGEFDGYPSGKVTETDYNQGVYAKAITGYLYNPNNQKMLICGVSSPNSTDMGPLVYKKQNMMVISYSGYDSTLQSLKSDAESERLMKFIGGAICFMLGFTLLLGPIIKLLDFIPFLGDLAIGIIYFICAIVSLILSVLFYIFFAFWWLIVIIGVGIPIFLLIIKPMLSKKTG